MKPARSANPNAENFVPDHRKNRNPRNTGRMFDKGETGRIDGNQMRMDSIHSCETVKRQERFQRFSG
jgi:hypothetical protein